MASEFAHLHVHSEYSLLDGAARLRDLVTSAARLGMSSLALTDHGVMYGLVEFYRLCKEHGVHPVLGCEVYVATRSRFDKTPHVDSSQHHLLLLAENDTGYKNLLKLVSKAYLEGFYYRPRVDRELLAEFSQGLIAMSACLAGAVPAALLAGDRNRAREAAGVYREIFGRDNFFLEMMDHGLPEQQTVNAGLRELSRELGIPLVATNDLHYVRKEDAPVQDTLLCIQTGKTIKDENRLRFETPEFYLKSASEMEAVFPDDPEALRITQEIAGRCQVDFDFNQMHLPEFQVPPGEDLDSYLGKLSQDGMDRRFPQGVPPVAQERLDYELAMLRQMGFAGYFLIVQDFVNWARQQGILVGPGRGSAAGSLVSYSLGITDLDPLKYGLIFERFLNPERITMPDIDIDFCYERRSEVIDYVVGKYGADHVAQIITFGTMAARGAIRDVGRVLNMPLAEVDRIAKLVPEELGITLSRALETSPELKQLSDESPEVQHLLNLARAIEGMPRHASTHAAGVVITREPLTHYLPLQRTGDVVTTQFPMETVEQIGLLKMDLLGLRTLTVLGDALRIINATQKPGLELDQLPLDDRRTYDMLSSGETVGVFQLESSGMNHLLRNLKPQRFDDLVPLVALYRPGPLKSGMVDDFISRKNGQTRLEYQHPVLESILSETYGVILYQEQVMQISCDLAGFSMAQADSLRRAMGKKKPEAIAKMREAFVTGAGGCRVEPRVAASIFDLMENFAGYGFNKCLTGDTRIVNAEGQIKTIKEIYESQSLGTVITLDNRFKLVKGKITAVYENGVHDVYELRTRTGRTIKATNNHKFMSFDGWKPLKSLRIGDHLAVPRCIPVSSSKTMPRYKLAVLSYIISEGNTCHPRTFYYYTSSKEELDDYLHYLSQFENTNATVVQRRGKYEVHVMNQKKGTKQFNEAKQFITTMGLQGKRAFDKCIPEEIFELNNDDIAFFLGKLWVGDACVDCKNTLAHYATSSEVLAHQVQHLLLRFSIKSTIHIKGFKYRGIVKKGYTVNITGYDSLQRFADLIGCAFVGQRAADLTQLVVNHPYLNSSLPATFARGSNDLIPYGVWGLLRKEVANKQGPKSSKQIAHEIGISERNFWAVNKQIKKGYRRETVQLVADYLHSPKLTRLAYADVQWDEIVSIEYAGQAMTYDLAVDETHSFVANDIIVHNSHSAAYALIAYQTAYLKANHPVALLAALLTSVRGNSDKVSYYIQECKRLGIEILPPDVNESLTDFTVINGDRIRFGLGAVKNVGKGAVSAIIEARQRGGPFRSLDDFCQRVDLRQVNKRVVESLILCGAYDSLQARRSQLVAVLDACMDTAQANRRDQNAQADGQVSLFDLLDEPSTGLLQRNLPAIPEYSPRELLAHEKEVLGFYVSGHPLAGAEDVLAGRTTLSISELSQCKEGERVTVGGIVSSMKRGTTRRGEGKITYAVEDLGGSVEVTLILRNNGKNLTPPEEDAVVLVTGRVSQQEDESTRILADQITPLEIKPARSSSMLYIRINPLAGTPDVVERLRVLFMQHHGATPVMLYFVRQKKLVKTDASFWVDPVPELQYRIEALCGPGSCFVLDREAELASIPALTAAL